MDIPTNVIALHNRAISMSTRRDYCINTCCLYCVLYALMYVSEWSDFNETLGTKKEYLQMGTTHI